ncbi:MAG: nitroreductase [Hyphomicrobiales bacterium]|nr:nitroreductase [Hyphomicrobiales bacterium]
MPQAGLLDVLARRRSQKPMALTGPGPDADQLATLLRLAARVPDHGKLVPWRFIVFQDEGRDRAGDVCARVWAQVNPHADATRLAIEHARFSEAPLVIGVVSRAAPHAKIPQWEQVLSAGAVCMNLTIAATAMGFVTCWLTDWMAYNRDAMRAFGLDEHETIAGFIHIGHAPPLDDDRVRPDMDAIIQNF